MSDLLMYKGYLGKVELDAEAGVLFGRVLGLRDVITFQGTSVSKVRKAFEESVDDYLAFCASRGETPEQPKSGKFNVRVDPETHRRIALAAERAGQSMNEWVARRLRENVEAEIGERLQR